MVKVITLKKRLLKWKQSWIYVLAGKLHTKIMQKEHDVFFNEAPWRTNHKSGHR
jgi:hypothetical protein